MDKSCIVTRFVELAGVDCHNSGQASEAEEAIAIKLLQYLDNLISATDQNAATSSTSGHLCEQYLQSDSGSDDDNDLHTDQDDAPNLQSSDDSDFEIDQKLQVGGVSRSLEDLQKVADYVKAHPTYKFSVVQRRFRWIKQQCMIPRILSAVEKNGNFRQKYADISKAVLAKYKDARRQLHPVHDTDLKKWAVDAARAIGIKFTASSYWIFKFKRQHRTSINLKGNRKLSGQCVNPL